MVVESEAAPKAVTAAAAVADPVPPLTMATMPVTFDAVPVVDWFKVGISAAKIAPHTGAALITPVPVCTMNCLVAEIEPANR